MAPGLNQIDELDFKKLCTRKGSNDMPLLYQTAD